MWRVIVALLLIGIIIFAVPLSAGEVTENQCNVIPGDADSSGALNLADMVYISSYLFDKDRPPCYQIQIGNCWTPDRICRMDLNCSGHNSMLDVLTLFWYLFDKDNPFMSCLGSDSGNCWTPIPCSTCCLPASQFLSFPTGLNPGLPDEITITADGPIVVPPGGGDVTLKVWLETDNTGAGSDIVGFSIPVRIRSSNPVAGVYLADTSVAFTYSGTAVEAWMSGSILSVNSDSNLLNLGGLCLWTGIASGTHLMANLKVHATDSTTLSFVFWPYPDNPYLALVTSLGEEYSPCAYKAGDLDRDGRVSIVDVVYLANIVLKSWANPGLPCLADVNGNASVSLADVMYLAKHVFKRGPAPSAGGGCCP